MLKNRIIEQTYLNLIQEDQIKIIKRTEDGYFLGEENGTFFLGRQSPFNPATVSSWEYMKSKNLQDAEQEFQQKIEKEIANREEDEELASAYLDDPEINQPEEY